MRTGIVILIVLFTAACTDISETVVFEPETQTAPGEDLSTLYPTIQNVYPGTLQTLDIPQDYPTDVIPESARFAVVFSDPMEHDTGEMDSAFTLFKNGEQIAHKIEQTATSRYFTIIPYFGTYQYGNTYDLRIYQFAYLDDDNTLYLNFEPLVETPATTLSPVNPEYVTYTFQTAEAPVEDNQPPDFLAGTPGPGDINVETDLASTSGSIVITLFDNSNPMIMPDSVSTATVDLYEIGTGTVDITVTTVTTDLNLKTYLITPEVYEMPLTNSATYRVRLSIGSSIEDVNGNRMEEYTYFFQTEL